MDDLIGYSSMSRSAQILLAGDHGPSDTSAPSFELVLSFQQEFNEDIGQTEARLNWTWNGPNPITWSVQFFFEGDWAPYGSPIAGDFRGPSFSLNVPNQFRLLEADSNGDPVPGGAISNVVTIPANPPNAPLSIDINLSNSTVNQQQIVWTQDFEPEGTEIWRRINFGEYVLLNTVASPATDYIDATPIGFAEVFEYKVRGVNSGVTGDFSDVVGASNEPTLFTGLDSLIVNYGQLNVVPNTPVISFPNLRRTVNGFVIGGDIVTTISLPVCTHIGFEQDIASVGLQIFGANSLTSIDVGQVVDCGSQASIQVFIQSTSLATLSMPSLTGAIDGFNISGCPNLANLTLTFAGISFNEIGELRCSGCKLSQAVVDGFLHSAVTDNDVNNFPEAFFTLRLEGGTNATPSVTGLADKATLLSKNHDVTTN